jgi:predicted site-specific integrase-resolvase
MGLKARDAGKTVVYARVSTAAQKPDLAKQTAALKA